MKPEKLVLKAFGSYVDQTIDFTKPTENLFLISGTTGSGKSTVFDGIVFALYGEPSGNDKAKNISFQSEFAPNEEPEVDFTFTTASGTYRILRKPTHYVLKKKKTSKGSDYTRKSETVELYQDGRQIQKAESVAKINAKIEEIIGLTKSQFMQVAMIAQGEFRDLLKAKTDAKKVMFRKLFKTEIYADIVDILKERKSNLEKDIGKMKTAVSTEVGHIKLDPASSNYNEMLRLQERLVRGELSNLDDFLIELQKTIDEANIHLEKLKDKCNEAEKKENEAIEAYNTAVNLQSSFQQLEDAQTKLVELETKKEEMLKLESEVQFIKDASEIKPVKDRLDTANKELTTLTERMQENEKKLPELEKEKKDAERSYQDIHQEYENQLKYITQLRNEIEDVNKAFRNKSNAQNEIKKNKNQLLELQNKVKSIEASIEELGKMINQYSQIIDETKEASHFLSEVQTKENDYNLLQTRYNNLIEEYKSINNVLKDIENKKAKLKQLESIFNKENKHYTDLFTQFINNQAGLLAITLENNKPCPVCGSTIHPSPCKIEERLKVSQEDVDSAKKKADEAQSNVQTLAGNIETLNNNVNNRLKDYHEQLEKLSKDLNLDRVEDIEECLIRMKKTIQQDKAQYKKQNELYISTIQNKEQTNQKLIKFKDSLSDYKQKTTKIAETVQHLENSIVEYDQKIGTYESEDAANRVLKEKESVFDNWNRKDKASFDQKDKATKSYGDVSSIYKKDQEDLPKRADAVEKYKKDYQNILADKKFEESSWQIYADMRSQLSDKEKMVKLFNNELTKTKATIEAAKKAIGNAAKPENIDALKAKREELTVQRKELDNIRTTLSTTIDNNNEVYEKLHTSHQKQAEIINQHARLDNLYSKLSGNTSGENKMDIETFVQRYYLKQILNAANKRFEKLSAGQFNLVLKEVEEAGKARNEGLDLMVYSLVTGKRRDVSTLSGGESFMAALSLALGMADTIQSNSSAIHLDMMFIDEGFGSLDNQSREQAVRILKNMASGDKLIGIISHVSELKQQIDNQLVVTKDANGSKAEWNIN